MRSIISLTLGLLIGLSAVAISQTAVTVPNLDMDQTVYNRLKTAQSTVVCGGSGQDDGKREISATNLPLLAAIAGVGTKTAELLELYIGAGKIALPIKNSNSLREALGTTTGATMTLIFGLPWN